MYAKKTVLFLFFILAIQFISTSSFAQLTKASDSTVISEEWLVFDKVDIEASFPGGDAAWRKYLEKNLNAEVPVKKKAPAGAYTVIIQFIVDKDGKVSEITPLTSHGYGMEEEVMRILRIAPRWKPASQQGRVVKAYRKQPVTFWIEEDKKKKKNKD